MDESDRRMADLEINTARWFRVLYLGAGASLVCGGIVAFVTTQDAGIRWMTLLMLGGCGLACVWFALTSRRRLTLEPEGIRGRPFGLVPWRDIKDVFVCRNNLNRVFAVNVHTPSTYYERLPRWRRSLWKLSQHAGFGDISFDITGLDIGSEELVRVVRERAHRSSPEPSNPALNPDGPAAPSPVRR